MFKLINLKNFSKNFIQALNDLHTIEEIYDDDNKDQDQNSDTKEKAIK